MTKRIGDSAEQARAREKKYRDKNREKRRAQSRAYYDRHRDSERVRNLERMRARRARFGPMGVRELRLRHRYGMSLDQYAAILESQGGVCAICRGTSPYTGKLGLFQVDHCHATNVVRGLLCFPCNSALGKFKDNEETLLAAVEYLRRPRVAIRKGA